MITVYYSSPSQFKGFYFQVWRPACPSGQSYCYRLNSCVQSQQDCNNVTQTRPARVCPSNSNFSVGGRGCFDSSGTKVNTTSISVNLLEFDTYYLREEIFVDFPTLVEGLLVYDFVMQTAVTLMPGDIAAIYRPNDSYVIPNTLSGNEPKLSVVNVANFDLRSQGLGTNGNTNVTFQASSLQNSGLGHQMKLYYSKPVYYTYPYTYMTHSCPTAPPFCKNDTIYKIKATVKDQNTSVALEDEILMQVSIDPVDFSFKSVGIFF